MKIQNSGGKTKQQQTQNGKKEESNLGDVILEIGEKKSELSEINSEFRDKLVRIRTCKLRIPRKSQNFQK